jgi:hypothetical protein
MRTQVIRSTVFCANFNVTYCGRCDCDLIRLFSSDCWLFDFVLPDTMEGATIAASCTRTSRNVGGKRPIAKPFAMANVGGAGAESSSSSSLLSFELFRINDDAQELQIDIGTLYTVALWLCLPHTHGKSATLVLARSVVLRDESDIKWRLLTSGGTSLLQRPLDRLTERTEARFVLEDALVAHSTDTLALIGIGQRGARAIDDVLLQFFIRCTQRCRASSFDFVVCHQVRWHGVRGVDFRLTLPEFCHVLVSACVFCVFLVSQHRVGLRVLKLKIARFSKILPSLLFLLVVVDESIESHFTVCTISNRNNNQTIQFIYRCLIRFSDFQACSLQTFCPA